MPEGRIAEIDGLRALAMLLVTAQHCGLMPIGWTGVWLFYVVSGFVIARNFEGGAYAGGTRFEAWGEFMRRRFWRIVPVYLFYVAVASLALVHAGRSEDLGKLWGLLTFTYNWQAIFGPPHQGAAIHLISHLWTLSVEEQFYLAFPLLFLLLGPLGYGRALVVLVAAGPLIRLVWAAVAAHWVPDRATHSFHVYAATFAHFDAFLIGALLARHEARVRSDPRVLRWLVSASLVWLVAHVTAYALVNRLHGAVGFEAMRNVVAGHLVGEGREASIYSLVDLLAATAIAAALSGRARWLAWRPLAWCGLVSYGAYLYHGFVIWLLVQVLGPVASLAPAMRLLLLAMALAVTFATAAMSWHWLEQPVRRWGLAKRPAP